jgi:hypothetical protein
MDSLSLMTLVVTYFFAALRQANHDDELSTGATATAIVVLVLNVLTMLALTICLCLDFKWVIPLVYRNVCAPKRIDETSVPPLDMPADIEARDNPLSGLRQEDTTGVEMIESAEVVRGNKGMEGLARDNQKLVAQLEALKADNATLKASHLVDSAALKASHLTDYAALKVENDQGIEFIAALKLENEGLRRRSLVTIDT